MRRIALIFMLIGAAAQAEDWRKLNTYEIRAVLSDATLDYNDGWQEFLASGRTLYNTGRDSWGYWEVRGGQYCSQWPPADGWACYDVLQSGDLIRFEGPRGDATEGQLRK